MQHLGVSGTVRHIYIYIYVIRRLKVNDFFPRHQRSAISETGIKSAYLFALDDQYKQ